MDGYGSGQRSYGGDRTLKIVSGKGFGSAFGASQIYVTRSHSPNLPPIPSLATRPSNTAFVKPWGFSDPETKRKKRIARYKVYTVEGKVKASLRKGFRWIKNKCSQIVHGY
ncbi:uncharacterized protein LOC123215876 [Mangifera indica]|uniref:uncharacterized protein LOC123215876 n=1 Tax=Mangifera indica TaxID=29780 RepID=UPI001CFB56FF|nr:uncharacterized protein LOC123215876 [Mangifera indica]